MIRHKLRSFSIVVIMAIALHLFWAALLVLDHESVYGATGLNALYRIIHAPIALSGILAIASALAICGIFTQVPMIIMLLMPQQALLLFSLAGAISAIYLGQYPDGVERPHLFIAADQIYAILIGIGHTIAIIAHAKSAKRG